MSLAGRSCQRDRSGRPAVTVAMRRRERKEHCDEGGEREERERERAGRLHWDQAFLNSFEYIWHGRVERIR